MCGEYKSGTSKAAYAATTTEEIMNDNYSTSIARAAARRAERASPEAKARGLAPCTTCGYLTAAPDTPWTFRPDLCGLCAWRLAHPGERVPESMIQTGVHYRAAGHSMIRDSYDQATGETIYSCPRWGCRSTVSVATNPMEE